LTTYVDNSLNTNYYTKAVIDASLTGIASTAGNVNLTPATALNITTPNSYINGNLDIGSGNHLVSINKLVAAGYHLDISGNLRVTQTITTNDGFVGTYFQPTAVGNALTIANITTTGNIDIGSSQTTGNLNLGIGTTRSATGSINIGTGLSATNNINIGTGTSYTGTISIGTGSSTATIVGNTNINTTGTSNTSIGNSSGTITINSPLTPSYLGTAPTTAMIGYYVTNTYTTGLVAWSTSEFNMVTGYSLTNGVWLASLTIRVNMPSSGSSGSLIRIGLAKTSAAFSHVDTQDYNTNGISGLVFLKFTTTIQVATSTTIYAIGQYAGTVVPNWTGGALYLSFTRIA
jgi:hypothetical protein